MVGYNADDNMDVSLNDEYVTDTDSNSYDYSYYGKTRTSYGMRERRGYKPQGTTKNKDNAIESFGTKNTRFKDFYIRRRQHSRNKQTISTHEEIFSPNINELLSPEILMKIFAYLCDPREISLRVLPVCRLWNKLGNDAMLWKSLVFSEQSLYTHKMMMETVKRRCRFLRSVTLKNFRNPNQMELMIDTLVTFCKSTLSEIRIFNCQLHSSEPLVNLGQNCSNIRTLCLVRCDSNFRKSFHYRASYMKDVSFLSAFTNLNTLCLFRTLAPATLSFDDAQTIIKAGRGSIKRLLLDCDFYGRGIRFIISALSDTLEVLWLQGRNYNDAMCQDISKCTQLRNLCLRHAQNITPIGLKALGRLTKIEKLLLFNTSKLSASGINCFFSSSFECGFLQSLKYLNLSGSKDTVSLSYNNQDEFDYDEGRVLNGIIKANCPNIEHVVIEKELVNID